jgi:purine-binding chemotaxis protein CheW
VTVYVRLQVGGEQYAAPVAGVAAVAGLDEVTKVPGAPPAVLGVRNLRGQILPVIDLAALLGTGHAGRPQRLLVAEAGGRRACLAVDGVSGVAELPEPAADTEARLLAGTVLDNGELIGVIELSRVFDAVQEAGGQ